MVRVSMIYDQGEAKFREDGLFVADPYFGVLDGVSAPYGPKVPMRKFGELSGGEYVARVIETEVAKISFSCQFNGPFPTTLPLRVFVKNLNWKAGLMQRTIYPDIGYLDSDQLAGATFAFARVGEKCVEIAQAGDSFAVWANKEGKVLGVTTNQVRGHDTEMNGAIDRILAETAQDGEFMRSVGAPGPVLWGTSEAVPYVGKIRGELWNRFALFLGQERLKDVNSRNPRGYGLMNGQNKLLEVMSYVMIPRSEVATIVLFTDGMMPWHVMKSKSDLEIGEAVYRIYRQGGLRAVLSAARNAEDAAKNKSYTNTAEATAVAIEL